MSQETHFGQILCQDTSNGKDYDLWPKICVLFKEVKSEHNFISDSVSGLSNYNDDLV